VRDGFDIHDHIRRNNSEQLKNLLPTRKRTIKLNSFNLSSEGDTILHSDAKSNDVKMIESILQILSPSAKEMNEEQTRTTSF
jgi:hypothetical protein